jgi:hypothetical protein
MRLLQILEESKFNQHKWEDICKQVGADFIHKHPEQKEVEFEYKGKHYLLEEEGGVLDMYVVTKVGNIAKHDSDNDIIDGIIREIDGE